MAPRFGNMKKGWVRLTGNRNGRNGSLSWFCSGCAKSHSISRDIELVRGVEKHCGIAMRRILTCEAA